VIDKIYLINLTLSVMKFENFKATFFNGNSDKRNLINQIKLEFNDFDALKKFIDRFRKEIKIASSLLNRELIGQNNVSKKVSDIRGKKNSVYSGSITKEINWLAVGFLDNTELLNSFIHLRDLYEKELMIGNYEEARLLLNRIEEEISLSFWSIENRFILDEYQYGPQKNWEYRNEIVDDANDIFLQVLGNMYSLKSEKRISFFQYNEYYSKWEESEQLYEDPEYEGLAEYFRYRGNFFFSKNYSKYSEILFFENNSTLIDRYVTFIRVLQQLSVENFKENSQILPAIIALKNKIKDSSLIQLLIVNDPNYEIKNEDINTEIIHVIDLYTQGNYIKSAEKCSYLISNGHGNIPELYEIYIKSLIESKSKYKPITVRESFVNLISELYFDCLSKTTNSDDVFIDLLKYAYLFNNSGIGLTIYEFVNLELGWASEIDYGFLSYLNSKFINPKLLNNTKNKPSISKKIITNLKQLYPQSSTIDVYSKFYDNYFNNIPIQHFDDIPEIKSELYRLRWLMIKEKYNECIIPYKQLLKKELSPISLYEIINSLFYCYSMENDYRNNIILYVESYLDNPQLTKKFNTSHVIESIITAKFKNVGDKSLLIELPIFFKLLSIDKIKVKQACELFLSSSGFNKPSEMTNNCHLFDKQKVTYFLSSVCTIEILQLSKNYDSTYDVNEERIKICQFLANFDLVNLETYNMEIALLTQKNTISKVIGKMDEGKIYVNEEKIRQLFLKKETKNEFSKIKELSGDSYLTKDFFLRTLDLKKFVDNNEYKRSRKFLFIDEKGIVNNNPAFDDFKKMFLELRNYFVWSKEYGLDAYLSTRIRHGTLVNHIRSVFELFNLVTTQVDGNYAENTFWKEKIKSDDNQLQKILSSFSKDIDLIINQLKEEVIQCKTEKIPDKVNGLFDFSYTTDIQLMILFFSGTEKYEDFLDLCFEELWKKTNKCLENIKIELDEKIKEGFVQLLNNLEEELSKSYKKPVIFELLNSLNQCRTEIQTKMNNVIKWFNRSESTFEGEYDLNILIDTSVQITKNTHPTYKYEIQKKNPKQIMIRGEFHQHIIDLINNFLFNMIKHSSLENEKLNAKIEIDENDGFLTMRFINYVDCVDKHFSNLKRIQENWTLADLNVTKEEGTGFPKIKKIIHSDLGRKESKFDFIFDSKLLTLSISFETKDLKI